MSKSQMKRFAAKAPVVPANVPAQMSPKPAPQMNAQPMPPVAPAAAPAFARGTHNPDNQLPAKAFHKR